MQPEPTELPTSTPLSHASESSFAPQYGIQPVSEPSAVPGDLRDGLVEPASSGVQDDADLPEQLRRLNVHEQGEKRPKASFQRIAEYENALSPSPARKREGPAFKIVKQKGNKAGTISFETFPNGLYGFRLLAPCFWSFFDSQQRFSHTSCPICPPIHSPPSPSYPECSTTL